MTPEQLLATSLLLGFFDPARRLLWRALLPRQASYQRRRCFGAATLLTFSKRCVAAAIAAFTPLEFGWKVLVVASCIAYLPIPPVTWRYLENLHEAKEQQT